MMSKLPFFNNRQTGDNRNINIIYRLYYTISLGYKTNITIKNIQYTVYKELIKKFRQKSDKFESNTKRIIMILLPLMKE
jgi:hypothetical protein